MPRLSGVFDEFTNLDKITWDSINRWLKIKLDRYTLENYIAGRIYYPQTVPVTKEEMDIDLAILKEALKNEGNKFYNPAQNKILIPAKFVTRFTSEIELIAAFVDGLKLNRITQVWFGGVKDKKLEATILLLDKGESNTLALKINDMFYKIKSNTLTFLPLTGDNLKLKIKDKNEEFISGGSLGIFIDLRNLR